MAYFARRNSSRTLAPGRRSGGSYNGGGRSRGGNNRKKTFVHPSRFVQAAKPVTEAAYISTNAFADFAAHDIIKSNLAAKGFVTPTPIQDQAIPHGLEGKDLVGIANTGTGKTAAFAVPVLHLLITNPKRRALIMAPTRELAQQIEEECRAIGRGTGLTGALLIGGTSMGPQLRDLRSRPRIVIGTPGRIKDHMERGTLDLSGFDLVVLDEVDRMLDMGFVHDVRTIVSHLAQPRQSFLFSATMEASVKSLIGDFTHEPVTVSVKTGETSDNVEQNIVPYRSKEEKLEKLHDLLNQEVVAKAIIFDETQRNVEKLHRELESRGFRTDALHGGKSQGHRQRALNKFKKGDITILIATDVAARGIDVADITHVINFTTPQSYEDYVHRVGRAGRAGRMGYALTFVEL